MTTNFVFECRFGGVNEPNLIVREFVRQANEPLEFAVAKFCTPFVHGNVARKWGAVWRWKFCLEENLALVGLIATYRCGEIDAALAFLIEPRTLVETLASAQIEGIEWSADYLWRHVLLGVDFVAV